MKNNSVRSICVASDGTVLASSSSRNVANAIRRAQWLLNNVDGAVRAFVPSSQYEVCR
jgi:hypothetical protein